MSDALDRIRERVATHTAAFGDPAAGPPSAPTAPANPPAKPVAPPQDAANQDQRLGDLEAQVAELSDQVQGLIQAAVDDAMSEMDGWAEQEPMMAALPGPTDAYQPAPYAAEPDETVVCPNCGLLDAPDAQFCDQCGFKLAGAAGVVVNPDGPPDAPAVAAIPACKTCNDTGSIRDGNVKCPDCGGTKTAAVLPVAKQNDLPDSAFAHIEPGGKKDETGKTVPRSLRHFPIHDKAHTANALARAPQSPFGDKAMPKIKAAAKKFGIDKQPASA